MKNQGEHTGTIIVLINEDILESFCSNGQQKNEMITQLYTVLVSKSTSPMIDRAKESLRMSKNFECYTYSL